MQALFGGGATNERDELLLLVSEWISGHVDAMVDDFQVRSPRKDGRVGLRGGDEPGPVSYYIEYAVHLRPAVDRVHPWGKETRSRGLMAAAMVRSATMPRRDPLHPLPPPAPPPRPVQA